MDDVASITMQKQQMSMYLWKMLYMLMTTVISTK